MGQEISQNLKRGTGSTPLKQTLADRAWIKQQMKGTKKALDGDRKRKSSLQVDLINNDNIAEDLGWHGNALSASTEEATFELRVSAASRRLAFAKRDLTLIGRQLTIRIRALFT